MSTVRTLWVTAVEREALAVRQGLSVSAGAAETDAQGDWRLERIGPGDAVLVAGVGKANGAAATVWAMNRVDPEQVISIGVAGTLRAEVGVGDVLVATTSRDADEGSATPEGFLSITDMGFPPGPGGRDRIIPPESAVMAWTDAGAVPAVIVTVSTCAGTDARREDIATRTGAAAEAMEGAAVLRGAAQLGVPGVEVRAISNTTGDRGKQVWDLDRALAALSQVVGAFDLARREPG